MNRKIISIALVLALTFSIVIPIALVGGAGVPNADHIYVTTFGGPETVDPAWAYDTASAEAIQNVYEPLCAFDGMSTANFVARLADDWPGYVENWETHALIPSAPHAGAPVGTAQTWYFHIRTGVTFHHGATLVPADVEYTFERGMLMDHTGGPQWMFYEPLLGKYASMDYDADKNGTLEATEYLTLENAIKASVESNATHVWFNLPAPYAPFQQILCQSWGMILEKDWAIAAGCWTGQYNNYTEFIRSYDPISPGPLMTPGPKASGAGPYKLAAMNTDPHTGYEVYEWYNPGYWAGWTGSHVQYATVKNVEEWSNRKAQFFSTDPTMQSDHSVVNRANIGEMHQGGLKINPVYPGFRLIMIPLQTMGCFYFNYNVTSGDYMPKLGANDNATLLSDRYMRLAIEYCWNATKYLEEYWLGEAWIPTTVMTKGTAYYNNSKPTRNINLTRAQEYFQLAWGGAVWSQGFSLKLTYNTGNNARKTVCDMIKDMILHRIAWPTGVVVNIDIVAIPWATYIPEMNAKRLPCFVVGWLADFPDPHNWFYPMMHPSGDYGRSTNVKYGLGNMALEWNMSGNNPAPPYTNALGEYVSAINNSYVEHLISTAIGEAPAMREALYNELMEIQYAEGGIMPIYQSVGRHYERSWIQGFAGTWNENPIAPGHYFYTQYKSGSATIYSIDISAAGTISNTTEVYPRIQIFHGEMQLYGSPAKINYTLTVSYLGTGPNALVFVGFLRNDTNYANKWLFPKDFEITLVAGGSFSGDYQWYEASTMSVGNWTQILYASPTATAGGEDVEDSNTANNRNASLYNVDARELIGDVRPDGEVNILDAIRLGNSFGLIETETGYNADANLKDVEDESGNQVINILDAIVLGNNFGKHWP